MYTLVRNAGTGQITSVYNVDDVTSASYRILPSKTFVFWQTARNRVQSYHDYASFCPTKHDVYSVWSTEGGLNVNCRSNSRNML